MATILKSKNAASSAKYVFKPSGVKSALMYKPSPSSSPVCAFIAGNDNSNFTGAPTLTAVGGTLKIIRSGGSSYEILNKIGTTEITDTATTTKTFPTSNLLYLIEFTLDAAYDFGYVAWTNNIILLSGLNSGQMWIDYSAGRPDYQAFTMRGKFAGATEFNLPIKQFDCTKVDNIERAFYNCVTFNQQLPRMPSVTVAGYAFQNAAAFDQTVENVFTNTAGVSMGGTFLGASSFNQPVGAIKLASGGLNSTFEDAKKFNQSLSGWDFTKTTNLTSFLAGASSFNQPVASWDISKVLNFTGMFTRATAFNQDCSAWCAKFNVEALISGMFNACGMSPTNYDLFLNALWLDIGTTRASAWAARVATKTFQATNIKYTSAGATARANLVAAGWTITDGGLST